MSSGSDNTFTVHPRYVPLRREAGATFVFSTAVSSMEQVKAIALTLPGAKRANMTDMHTLTVQFVFAQASTPEAFESLLKEFGVELENKMAATAV